ncbi:hypothetical protein [Pleionea sediminis]|uniref:hypothetical protein n=1 Tax=Pleionea sediminis TaxID=2569479 RepID=UPI001185A3A7|nr:hypothetical protein [Pleionea sediminis]
MSGLNNQWYLKLISVGILSLTVGCGGGSGGNGSPDVDDDDDTPDVVTFTAKPETRDTVLGTVFVNADNITLYTFENDRNDSGGDGAGDSDCNNSCAVTWPPMLASSTAEAEEPFSIITRDSGERQWAFRGLPLYMFASDTQAGDVNGEGMGNVWFVARPDPLKLDISDDSAVGEILIGQFTQLGTNGSGEPSTDRLDRNGFSLYTFKNDRDDTSGDGVNDSDCNASCAEAWPPLFADAAATEFGNYTIIERDDGNLQWTYAGQPLYFYAGDSNAGDVNGDGLGGTWYLARPHTVSLEDNILKSATPTFATDGSGALDDSQTIKSGFALYVFDNDDTDESNCNGSCAVNWPPLYAFPGVTPKENFSIIERDDGSLQWAFKGQPLYYFAGDSSASDTNGDQAGGTWHLARTAPVQLFNDSELGDVFAARGNIEDVNASGNPAGTFTDRTGFTVYLFDEDGTDVSNCNNSCAVTWPPLYASESDVAGGDFSIFTREDGSLQWSYKGAPLYFYIDDSAPGQFNGIYGTWHEVTP